MKIVRFVTPIIVFLILWEITSHLWQAKIALFPPPSWCASALVEWIRDKEFVNDLVASYSRLLYGLVWGTVAGILIGLLTGRSRACEAVFVPLIRLFRPLPPVALIPLFIVWFGIGERAKIFAIGFAVFFPVWLNTFAGARQIPQRLLWSASTLTRSRWRLFWRVIVPASLPNIITGLRLGIAMAFVMVFVAELMGTDMGIGYKISIWQLAYRMDSMIAALAVLGASGALADCLFTTFMFWRFPWLRLVERVPEETQKRPAMSVERRLETRLEEPILRIPTRVSK